MHINTIIFIKLISYTFLSEILNDCIFIYCKSLEKTSQIGILHNIYYANLPMCRQHTVYMLYIYTVCWYEWRFLKYNFTLGLLKHEI